MWLSPFIQRNPALWPPRVYDHLIKNKNHKSFYYFEHPVNATTLLLQLEVNLIKILQVHSTRVPLFKSLKIIAALFC